MKFFYAFVILFFLNNCSFDNKSGIWKNENSISNNEDTNVFKDFKKISSSREQYAENISIKPEFVFKLEKPEQNNSWSDFSYNKNNNFKNFKYTELNQVFLKTKKLSKYATNQYLLFENNNLILNDQKGNVIIYSINKNSIISKFNFYKKKYKKIKKNLNLIVDSGVIYVSDNIGYIYAYDYNNNEVLWAKNYKVPFRSNLKITSNKVITSNQNNDLFILDKSNGNLIKQIPSEETIINNSFVNNIALSDNEIFFLNSYGSLYSIDINNFNLNWFMNLNQSLDLNLANLFLGSEIVYHNKKIFLSSNNNFYVIDSKNGSIINKKNFSSLFKPIVTNNYIFIVTENNFLVSMNLQTGAIIYSYEISQKVAKFINSKKKILGIKNLMLVNNALFIFLNNSHIIKFNIRGEIDKTIKLPSHLSSQPIFIDNFLLYLNKKNKLLLIN